LPVDVTALPREYAGLGVESHHIARMAAYPAG
jgi:hypothetical protein